MKRLLLLSSALCILLLSLESCKVKKKEKKKEVEAQSQLRDASLTAQDSIVRSPGVQNQAELDSIKAVLRNQKRKK